MVDWLVTATAAHHGMLILHDDADFRAAARVLSDVQERNLFETPGG